MFINDLPDKIVALIKLFADDTKIFKRIKSLQDCIMLQYDLTELQNWSKTWLLRCNNTKCKMLRLGSNPPSFQYVMSQPNGKTVSLEEFSCERDLGVIVDHHLKFNQHVDMAVGKANRMLRMIRHTLTFKDRDSILLLYKSLVRCLRYTFGARLCVDERRFRFRFDMLVNLFPSYNTLSLESGTPNCDITVSV